MFVEAVSSISINQILNSKLIHTVRGEEGGLCHVSDHGDGGHPFASTSHCVSSRFWIGVHKLPKPFYRGS
jgi:hypothetical protein